MNNLPKVATQWFNLVRFKPATLQLHDKNLTATRPTPLPYPVATWKQDKYLLPTNTYIVTFGETDSYCIIMIFTLYQYTSYQRWTVYKDFINKNSWVGDLKSDSHFKNIYFCCFNDSVALYLSSENIRTLHMSIPINYNKMCSSLYERIRIWIT